MSNQPINPNDPNNRGNYQSIPTDEEQPDTESSSSSSSSQQVQLSPRSAFARGDITASKLAHEQMKRQRSGEDGTKKEEGHSDAGDYIKQIIYGGIDGIITSFATVTSVAGADLSNGVILVLGISHLFADGIAMGMGDYLSSKAEFEFIQSERNRERWEMENNMKGELEEMIDLYKSKGIEENDAKLIINTMAKYPDFFLDHMMVEELGLLPPSAQSHNAATGGMITMISFIIFGSIPLLPYIIALIHGIPSMTMSFQLWAAIIITIVTLFLLGVFKSTMVEKGRVSSWITSGSLMALNGSFAAFIGYACGFLVAKYVENGEVNK